MPPGPRGSTLLGCVNQMLKNRHLFILKTFQEFGDIHSQRGLFGAYFVRICDPELAREIMSSKATVEKVSVVYILYIFSLINISLERQPTLSIYSIEQHYFRLFSIFKHSQKFTRIFK